MEFNPVLVFSILAIMAIGAGALIWAIVRFSFISEKRTKGWEKRLRVPQPEEFSFSHANRVADFYRTSPLIEEGDIALRAPDGTVWEIERFIPFTKVDVDEWKKITGVAGIPIATDYSKGVYFFPQAQEQAQLFYQPAGPRKKAIPVAVDINALDTFQKFEEA